MMLQQKVSPEAFVVKNSTTLLLLIFMVAIGFTILLFFYPGHAFLGSNFWPLVALPGLLALACGYKLIFNSPILKIDKQGIIFYRSGIKLQWQQMETAYTWIQPEAQQDAKDLLTVKYIDHQQNALLEINFEITGSMSKSIEQVSEAIDFYKPH